MGAAAGKQAGYDSPQAYATKLAQPSSGVLLAFMSPQCGLCASLRPALDEVAASSSATAPGQRLQVAVIDAGQEQAWAPEMLAYQVQTVPCFVLLGPDGCALCKTPPPRNRQQMEAALQEMVQHADSLPQRQRRAS